MIGLLIAALIIGALACGELIYFGGDDENSRSLQQKVKRQLNDANKRINGMNRIKLESFNDREKTATAIK